MVTPRRRQTQGYLIFVIVVTIVGTQPYENSQLVISQRGGILCKGVGMHKHLQALVTTQIKCGVFVNCLRFAMAQMVDNHIQRGFIAFDQLRLRGILLAIDARRNDIIHGRFLGILLNTDSAHRHCPRSCTGIKVVFIDSPITPHKV